MAEAAAPNDESPAPPSARETVRVGQLLLALVAITGLVLSVVSLFALAWPWRRQG